MKKVIFLISLLFFILKAEIKIEKVLVTESISEYNRWVKENKSKYPELEPIYFQIKQIKDGKYQPDAPITFDPPPEHPSTDIYEIYYYDYEKLSKIEQIIGYIEIRILEGEKYLVIKRRDYGGNTILVLKDKSGKKLFELSEDYVFMHLRDNYFIMEPYLEEGPLSAFDKLPIINIEKGPKPVKYIYNITPYDITYGIRYIAAKTYEREIVIFSYNFEEIWRKKFQYSGEPLLGNKFIVIGNVGKVLIFDTLGELKYIYIPEENPAKQYAMSAPFSIFINHEKFLVTLSPSHKILTLFDIESKKEKWRKELPCTPMVSSILKYLFSLFDKYILLIYRNKDILVGGILVINQEGDIINKLDFNLPKGKVKVFERMKAGKKIKFNEYEWDWRVKFKEPFLIITGKKNKKTEIDKFIVYKFSEKGG